MASSRRLEAGVTVVYPIRPVFSETLIQPDVPRRAISRSTGRCNLHNPNDSNDPHHDCRCSQGGHMATRFTNDSTVSISKRSHRSARRSSRTKKLLLLATAGLLLYPSVGCTMATGLGSQLSHTEFLDDFMVGYRNQAWAAKAWHCRKHRFCNKQYLDDVERGFRDGYESVAKGGNGCMPAVCPSSYWGWQYQTSDGQARMNAWFEGFPLGVQAAEQDGIGHWSQVRTSMAVPPPVSMPLAAPAALSVMESEAATGSLSDQAESIPAPMADTTKSTARSSATEPGSRSGTSAENVSGSTLPAASDKAATKSSSPTLPESKPAASPKTSVPSKPAASPKADLGPVMPDLTPNLTPAVPQPNADPFGFN
jgi:hypothetical protein